MPTAGSLHDLIEALPRRYAIEREIGRGTASVVYLAREEPPDRMVVIKILHPTLSAAIDRRRFLREVDVTTRLQHPYIVPIFATGEAVCPHSGGSCLYYVMPFVPGESLRKRLVLHGKLSFGTAISIAHDVADALDYAHRHGFIHRDIKPENILLDESHAYIGDFGIARACKIAFGDRVTQEHRTVGTPPYMSPEQIEDEELDGRTDIYSLACVLYEMLTGVPPFRRMSRAGTLHHLLTDPPRSLRADRPDAPPELDRALHRALAKRPAERHATSLEFVREVSAAAATARLIRTSESPSLTVVPVPRRFRAARWIPAALLAPAAAAGLWWLLLRPPAPGAAGSRFTDSIAVLVFRDLTNRPDLETVGALLTDEIHHRLALDPGLRVTALQSAFALQHSALGIRQIADTLGVGHVLEGSIRLRDDTVLIRVTLWNADETTVWVTGIAVPAAGVTAGVDPIAQRIAARITATTPARAPPPRAGDASGPGAAQYQRGMRWMQRRTPEGLASAVAAFDTAITLDPRSAQAHAALSTALSLSLFYHYRTERDQYAIAGQALAHAEQALASDPLLADAYSARAYLVSRAWGPLALARRDFAHAQELAPDRIGARGWRALLLGLQNRPDAALEEVRRAVRLDPLSPGPRTALIIQAVSARRYDIAIEEAAHLERLAPGVLLPRRYQALAYLLDGHAARCLGINLGPHAGIRAACLAAVGNQTAAARLVDSLTAALLGGGPRDEIYHDALHAGDLALYYAWRGDARGALRWLRRALELCPSGLDPRLLHSAMFDRVRGDSAFQAGVAAITATVWPRVEREGRRYAGMGG